MQLIVTLSTYICLFVYLQHNCPAYLAPEYYPIYLDISVLAKNTHL